MRNTHLVCDHYYKLGTSIGPQIVYKFPCSDHRHCCCAAYYPTMRCFKDSCWCSRRLGNRCPKDSLALRYDWSMASLIRLVCVRLQVQACENSTLSVVRGNVTEISTPDQSFAPLQLAHSAAYVVLLLPILLPRAVPTLGRLVLDFDIRPTLLRLPCLTCCGQPSSRGEKRSSRLRYRNTLQPPKPKPDHPQCSPPESYGRLPSTLSVLLRSSSSERGPFLVSDTATPKHPCFRIPC